MYHIGAGRASKAKRGRYYSLFFAGGKFIYFCKDEVQVSSLGDKFYNREEKVCIRCLVADTDFFYSIFFGVNASGRSSEREYLL